MKNTAIKRTYIIPFTSDRPAFIDYLFDHHHFSFNEAYGETAKNAVEDYGYMDGDIVFKWGMRDAEISFEVKDGCAIVYGMINGKETPVAKLENLSADDADFLSHSKKKVRLNGGLGKEIIENDETGKYRFSKETFYPWKFTIYGEAYLAKR